MRLSFTEFYQMREYESKESLDEKLIVYNNDARYGQIVFLAGGAGSGKGFAIKNFMHSELFKIRDVDELKTAFQELDRLKKFTLDDLMQKYGDKLSDGDKKFIQDNIIDHGLSMKDLNLKTKAHVYALHVLVGATGVKNKTLDLIMNNAVQGRLPNIIFDMTFKNMGDLNETVPKLVAAGYAPKDIHITWVLTDYELAIKNNAGRARVVPDDIMLATHKGAAITVTYLIKNGMPNDVDGGFYVILNNRKNTIFRKDPNDSEKLYMGARGHEIDPKTGEKKGHYVIKDFKYLTLKKPGKAMTTNADIKKELYSWITDNIPKDALDKIAMDPL